MQKNKKIKNDTHHIEPFFTMNKKIAAYLETGRVSNLPTVWSNILLAYTLSSPILLVGHFLLFCLAGSLLYLGGCFLGDLRDVEFDRKHKPQRPIPAGVLQKNKVLWLTICFFFSSNALLAWISPNRESFLLGAGCLNAVIICYALWHKKSPWLGLPLIAGCRLFLVLGIAVLGIGVPEISVFASAGAVAIYTCCFASVARSESSTKKISAPNLLKCLMLILPFVAFLDWQQAQQHLILFALFYLPYLLWLLGAFRFIQKEKGRYVSQCLAGFALLDASLLAAQGSLNALLCLGLFALALFLQQFTPAT